MTRRELTDRLLSVVFPQTCVLCGEAVEYGADWCGRCDPAREPWVRSGEGFDAVVSALRYEGNTRKAILALKKRPDRRIARFLAVEMAASLACCGYPAAHCIVPVPQSELKIRTVGRIQTQFLAEQLGVLLGLPVMAGLLHRSDHAQPQHELNRRKRRENARGAYSASAGARLNGEHVLLVDDVLTTGATAGACADLLREMGASRVVALTAASVHF